MSRDLPPAGIDDFVRSSSAEALRQGWSDQVSGPAAQIKDPAQYDVAGPLFYHELGDSSGVPDSDPQIIPWNGFRKRPSAWTTTQRRVIPTGGAFLFSPSLKFFRDLIPHLTLSSISHQGA